MLERNIEGSPWRNRREFDRKIDEATLEAIASKQEGVVFEWVHINIFGEKISLVLENNPDDEVLGPHATLLMTRGDETETIDINIADVEIYRKENPRGDERVLDVGDGDQIPQFIGVCARALEVGMHPDVIIDAAMEMKIKGDEPVHGRKTAFEAKRRDFSRQLSERQFI